MIPHTLCPLGSSFVSTTIERAVNRPRNEPSEPSPFRHLIAA